MVEVVVAVEEEGAVVEGLLRTLTVAVTVEPAIGILISIVDDADDEDEVVRVAE